MVLHRLQHINGAAEITVLFVLHNKSKKDLQVLKRISNYTQTYFSNGK